MLAGRYNACAGKLARITGIPDAGGRLTTGTRVRSVTEHLKALQNHAPSLAQRGWRLAWSLLRHRQEAEDVVQEAFMVAARKPMQFPLDDPWPWFGTVIAGLARNARRKRARRVPQELPVYLPAQDDSPGQQAARLELSRLLESEIENLPSAEHEALVLVHIGGLTFRQAAGAMGVPEGTLPHYVRRGQEKLRRAFGKPDEACMALMVGAIPAMPRSLLDSVTASLSSAATSATPKLLTGAAMIRLAMLLLPLAMLGLVAQWAITTPETSNDVSSLDPDSRGLQPGGGSSPFDDNGKRIAQAVGFWSSSQPLICWQNTGLRVSTTSR